MAITVMTILMLLMLKLCYSARILAVLPTPIKSHQIVFRPLLRELSKRGHEVTVIDAGERNATENLTVINIDDVSHKYIQEYNSRLKGKVKTAFEISSYMFERQLLSDEVQELINKNTTFDVLFIEMCVRPALVFSHIFKAPVILISSFGGLYDIFDVMGGATHHMLYPLPLKRKIHNLSLWQKIKEIYIDYKNQIHNENLERWEDDMLKRVLGPNVPSLNDLKKNIDLVFLNINRIWDSNRPVPPNIVYLGGLHLGQRKTLEKGLQDRLNSSVGAIYMSFGTNVDPSTLPPEKIRIFTRVFSRLPYTVLWKLNDEKLPGVSENVVISKWFPQLDILHHSKIKVFITQGGLHSTEEAIDTGVPLLGIPLIGDQWYNTEKYEYFQIGIKIELEMLTERSLEDALNTLINDVSYRHNIMKLRKLIKDQPEVSITRAIWWTEYIIRHHGAKHILAASAHLMWKDYYDIDLVIITGLFVVITTLVSTYFVHRLVLKITSLCII